MSDEFVPSGAGPACARCGHLLQQHMVGLHTGARFCPTAPNTTDTYTPRIPPDETLRDRGIEGQVVSARRINRGVSLVIHVAGPSAEAALRLKLRDVVRVVP